MTTDTYRVLHDCRLNADFDPGGVNRFLAESSKDALWAGWTIDALIRHGATGVTSVVMGNYRVEVADKDGVVSYRHYRITYTVTINHNAIQLAVVLAVARLVALIVVPLLIYLTVVTLVTASPVNLGLIVIGIGAVVAGLFIARSQKWL